MVQRVLGLPGSDVTPCAAKLRPSVRPSYHCTMRFGAALVESAFAWVCAMRGREACVCKGELSLVSEMVGGVMSHGCL